MRIFPVTRLLPLALWLVVAAVAAACGPAAGEVVQPTEQPDAQGTAAPAQLHTLARPAPDPHATARPAPRSSGPPATPVSAAPARPARDRTAPSSLDGNGRLGTVPGDGRALGTGTVRDFAVEVEGGLGVDAAAFAETVESVLGDRRGWTSKGDYAFRRVDDAAEFKVTLASPDLVDALCSPLDTGGRYSCWNGGRAVLNAQRWRDGADAYGDDLANYRRYMVNHEVGHGLGYGHLSCAGEGRTAPVMMQQTKGVDNCRPNPWPYIGD